MLNLKKTAIAVLALGSSAVFAGSMGPVCSAVNVTVPCENTAWDFGAKALYLQPSLTGNLVGTERTITGPSGSGVTLGKNPQWNWGFMIEGSYHFNTGNDVNVNWYHLNKSNTRNFSTSGPYALLPGGVADLTLGAGQISVDPHWDAVNFEVGQHVDFGENKSIRFHGGAQYVRLTGNSSIYGSAAIASLIGPIAADFALTANPTYNGFGPRMGADMAYDWGNGLGIYANSAVAVLAGSSKFSNSVAVGPIAFTGSGSSTVIVPELEAKLGATYTYAMAQGDLTLDAGWMWVNYFNVMQKDVTGLTPDNGDFGLQGPFIGLKWLGNVA